jgi:hypothetical protein
MSYAAIFIAGCCIGVGVCHTNTGTRTGNGIAGMTYIAAALAAGLALITGT